MFWAGREGTLIAADWAEGFLQAIMLRTDAWKSLLKSKRDGHLLLLILAPCGDENGVSLLGIPLNDEDLIMEEVTEFIPACVAAIATYWREKGPKQVSMPLTARAPSKFRPSFKRISRNDPCPCGSGKKYKRSCGRTA